MSFVCLGGSAIGQQQIPALVELTYDDGVGISGELLDFANGKYRLKTSVGIVTIPDEGVACNGSACPDKGTPANSFKGIKLISLDKSTVLTGELVEIRDGLYVVSTSVGIVEIEMALVECEGKGCIGQQSR